MRAIYLFFGVFSFVQAQYLNQNNYGEHVVVQPFVSYQGDSSKLLTHVRDLHSKYYNQHSFLQNQQSLGQYQNHKSLNQVPEYQSESGQRSRPHPQSTYSSRSGPLENILTSAKSWFSSGQPVQKEEVNLPPRMREVNRLPKPPKYPLYDLDSISMATPPPAPLMHPMSSLPTHNLPVFAKPSNQADQIINRQGGNNNNRRNNHQNNHRRPMKPGQRHGLNGQSNRRPLKKNQANRPPVKPSFFGHLLHPSQSAPHSAPHNTPPKQNQNQNQEYYSHPMASNVEAVKTSPALGRPLGYDEYMARPSHSFVNDPWNFDPFANQMNQGLNTHALKYNYDPLGMNTLETAASDPSMAHLDPKKLSYLGDTYTKDQTQGGSTLQQYNGNVYNQQYNSDYNNNKYNNNYNNYQNYNQNQQNYNNYNNKNNNNNNNGDQSTGMSELNQGQGPNPPPKIEFTIETSMSADGKPQINIEQTGAQSTINEYENSSPPQIYGPNGYESSVTPQDMLPPPTQSQAFYQNNNQEFGLNRKVRSKYYQGQVKGHAPVHQMYQRQGQVHLSPQRAHMEIKRAVYGSVSPEVTYPVKYYQNNEGASILNSVLNRNNLNQEIIRLL